MRAEYSQRAEQMVEGSNKARSTPGWPDLEQKYPVLVKMFDENNARLRATPEWSVSVVPALLAIESLLALALAWAMYHRLSPVAIGPALGGVREFRFNDQLIWGLAVGATIAFLPPFRDARNAGFNLLLFFGTLYLLRGVGVLSWVSRGRGVATVLVLMTVFAFPLVGALAFCVGVGDTWMDWRNRVQSANV
jgi:hypothetical protein